MHRWAKGKKNVAATSKDAHTQVVKLVDLLYRFKIPGWYEAKQVELLSMCREYLTMYTLKEDMNIGVLPKKFRREALNIPDHLDMLWENIKIEQRLLQEVPLEDIKDTILGQIEAHDQLALKDTLADAIRNIIERCRVGRNEDLDPAAYLDAFTVLTMMAEVHEEKGPYSGVYRDMKYILEHKDEKAFRKEWRERLTFAFELALAEAVESYGWLLRHITQLVLLFDRKSFILQVPVSAATGDEKEEKDGKEGKSEIKTPPPPVPDLFITGQNRQPTQQQEWQAAATEKGRQRFFRNWGRMPQGPPTPPTPPSPPTQPPPPPPATPPATPIRSPILRMRAPSKTPSPMLPVSPLRTPPDQKGSPVDPYQGAQDPNWVPDPPPPVPTDQDDVLTQSPDQTDQNQPDTSPDNSPTQSPPMDSSPVASPFDGSPSPPMDSPVLDNLSPFNSPDRPVPRGDVIMTPFDLPPPAHMPFPVTLPDVQGQGLPQMSATNDLALVALAAMSTALSANGGNQMATVPAMLPGGVFGVERKEIVENKNQDAFQPDARDQDKIAKGAGAQEAKERARTGVSDTLAGSVVHEGQPAEKKKKKKKKKETVSKDLWKEAAWMSEVGDWPEEKWNAAGIETIRAHYKKLRRMLKHMYEWKNKTEVQMALYIGARHFIDRYNQIVGIDDLELDEMMMNDPRDPAIVPIMEGFDPAHDFRSTSPISPNILPPVTPVVPHVGPPAAAPAAAPDVHMEPPGSPDVTDVVNQAYQFQERTQNSVLTEEEKEEADMIYTQLGQLRYDKVPGGEFILEALQDIVFAARAEVEQRYRDKVFNRARDISVILAVTSDQKDADELTEFLDMVLNPDNGYLPFNLDEKATVEGAQAVIHAYKRDMYEKSRKKTAKKRKAEQIQQSLGAQLQSATVATVNAVIAASASKKSKV